MDIRLVVSDMDGTLLLDDGTIPAEFWPLLADMSRRGISFVPASGRQLATLRRLFDGEPGGDRLAYIAENGTLIATDEGIVSMTTVADESARAVVEAVRAAVARGADLGVVVCRADGALIERTDEPFVAECAKYYVELSGVGDTAAHLATKPGDLLDYCTDVLKLAIFDFGDAATSAASYFGEIEEQVVVSGRHWIDIMNRDANKGVGVRELQRRLGVTAEQTAAFGDYLNDVEMLDTAGHSYAVANAHPRIKELADHEIASNADGAVVTAVRELLDAQR